MLLGNDVLNVEGDLVVVLVNPAILVAVCGPSTYRFSGCRVRARTTTEHFPEPTAEGITLLAAKPLF